MAVAITAPSPARLSNLRPLWHRSAPRHLVEKCPADDPVAGWTAWRKHLRQRKRPGDPKFLQGNGAKRPPLLWGWPTKEQQFCTTESKRQKGCRIDVDRILAANFAESGTAANVDLNQALQSVALAYALPKLAGKLVEEAWWKLAERLHDLAVEAQQQHVDWQANPSDVLRQQLLGGELPLALSYLFPELRAMRALREPARAALSEALVELTDGQGLPHARLLPVFGALAALWTRARWIGERLKGGSWSSDAELQYEWLVRHALRLVDAEGRFMLVPGDTPQVWIYDMFATALELVGDSDQCAIAAAMLPKRVVPQRVKFDRDDLPEPSLESDWAGISVLASGWSPSDTRLALAFTTGRPRIELSLGRKKLLAGDWDWTTTCDGTSVEAVSEWEEICWQTGKRFDLLEISIDLSGGLQLERQLLLARDDGVLYLTDIVIGPDDTLRQLQHSVRLPLGPGVAWQPAAETRDGVLAVGKRQTALLPLALHEWRCDPRGGSLVEENGQLVLTQEITGRALYCPLLLDLKPQRSKLERTWRQLTVAEALEIVPRDIAVGFRAQSGDDQWLFYRSLGRAGNRTVLGHNVAGEFTAGRFRTSGKMKPWIEIESD